MSTRAIGVDHTAETHRPMRDLLLLMPYLKVLAEYNIDYEGAEPALLHQVGVSAEMAIRTIHRGTAVIGRMLVAISPEIGMGEFSTDSIEALGGLICEVSDFVATAHSIATSCQRFNADYCPGTPKHIPIARP